MKKFRFVAVIVIASSASGAWADDQLAVTPAVDGGWASSNPYDWGYAFQVSSPIEVTALAYFMATGDIDFQPHTIGIWDDLNHSQPLAQASVGAGSPVWVCSAQHSFRTAAISPIVLWPGRTYVVSGTPGYDDFMYQNNAYFPGGEIMVLEGRYGYGENGYAGGYYGLVALGGNFVYHPASCTSPADLNCDGTVDGADLGTLLAAWGNCGACVEDFNHDGVVDGADLGQLLADWGG